MNGDERLPAVTPLVQGNDVAAAQSSQGSPMPRLATTQSHARSESCSSRISQCCKCFTNPWFAPSGALSCFCEKVCLPLNLFWLVYHVSFVVMNNSNLWDEPDKQYEIWFVFAFSAPQVDAIFNIAFAYYLSRNGGIPQARQVLPTSSTEEVSAGSEEIPITSAAGFAVADAISISSKAELNEIAGFTSIKLARPLKFTLPAGTAINKVTCSTPASTLPATPEFFAMQAPATQSTEIVRAGSNNIPIISAEGFAVADAISIKHEVEDVNEIVDFTSIKLARPLQDMHPAGTAIKSVAPVSDSNLTQNQERMQASAILWEETRDRWTQWLVRASVVLVCVRCLLIYLPRMDDGAAILAVGSVIEISPHFPALLSLERQMKAIRTELSDIRRFAFAPETDDQKCLAMHSEFFSHVGEVSRRWQVFLLLSVLFEAYAMLFQYIWLLQNDPFVWFKSGLQITFHTFVMAVLICFKVGPVAAFNYSVDKTPEYLVEEVAEAYRQAGRGRSSHAAETLQEGNGVASTAASSTASLRSSVASSPNTSQMSLDRMRSNAMTLSWLFQSKIPYFRVALIGIRKRYIASLLTSVVFGQGLRRILELGNQKHDPAGGYIFLV